jgi:hypothetical protein
LENLNEGSIEYDECVLAIRITKACGELQLSNISSLAKHDMLSKISLILDNEVILPLAHKLTVTKVMLTAKLGDGDIAGWVDGLVPWAPSSSWIAPKAVFSGCCPTSQQDAHAAGFRDIWQQTVLCSAWLTAFNGSLDGGIGPGIVLRYSRAALAELCKYDAPDWASEALEPVMKILKGVVAMCGPIPKLFDSKTS